MPPIASALKLLIIGILFFFPKYSIAQTQDVKFTLISGSNGISLGKINGIARDIHGVMWF